MRNCKPKQIKKMMSTNIKPEELRIGNWIKCYAPAVSQPIYNKVEGVGLDEVFFKIQQPSWFGTTIEETLRFGINYIEPISLTEEWLKGLGFEKPAYSWCGDKFHLSNYDKNKSLWCVAMNKNNAIVAHIRYVHELQNLYFDLTGKELEWKESEVEDKNH